jgi:hypothetical protein
MDKMDIIAIKDIRTGMKNINVMFIVLEITAATKTKENREVFSFKIADQSAAINCSIWDEPGKVLQPGDIVRMTKCYASLWRGCLTLYSGKSGEISRMGDFVMTFNETLNMSELPINPPAAQTQPANNGTNGNGRPPINSAATPAATSNNTTDKPKGNSNSNSRNYIRKPINKK